MDYFVFNGVPSTDIGLVVYENLTHNAPERDVETVEIPGRNGDLVIDNGKYKNIVVEYPVVLMDKFGDVSDVVRNALYSDGAYHRLEDSFNPDTYRVGRIQGSLVWDMYQFSKKGKAVISFDCKPQKFFKSGEVPVVVTEQMTFINPSRFPASPHIRVYAKDGNWYDKKGYLWIGSTLIQIEYIDGYVDIDCELMECYKGHENKNSYVILNDFPKFNAGTTGVRFEGSIDHLEITPRWWTL